PRISGAPDTHAVPPAPPLTKNPVNPVKKKSRERTMAKGKCHVLSRNRINFQPRYASTRGNNTTYSLYTCACISSSISRSPSNNARYVLHAQSGGAYPSVNRRI